MLFATFLNAVGQGNTNTATNTNSGAVTGAGSNISQDISQVAVNSADISNAIPVINSAIINI